MKTLGSGAENRVNEFNGPRRQKTGHRNKIKDVAAGSDKLMASQKSLRWLSKNFVLQGVVVFQG
jgi:hypothetical protein